MAPRETSAPTDTTNHHLFDAYLAVDWSAAGKPKKGKDSIWWCLAVRSESGLELRATSNPATRSAAADQIREALRELASAEIRVLVGFDFPYGFPWGLASALGLEGLPWKATWDHLETMIDDAATNASNRFEVAGALNDKIHGGPGPFWGVPQQRAGKIFGLASTAPPYPFRGLERLRLTEQKQKSQLRSASPKPTWQLYGAGSVGSQALLGIPRVNALLKDPELRDYSAVWPFADLPEIVDRNGRIRIVHAEIYPSLEEIAPDPASVKDEGQVKAVVHRFARADSAGTLQTLLRVPYELPLLKRTQVLTEEGWILGIGAPAESRFTLEVQ